VTWEPSRTQPGALSTLVHQQTSRLLAIFEERLGFRGAAPSPFPIRLRIGYLPSYLPSERQKAQLKHFRAAFMAY